MFKYFMKLTVKASGKTNYVNLRNLNRVVVENSGEITLVFNNGTSIECSESEHHFLACLPEGSVV